MLRKDIQNTSKRFSPLKEQSRFKPEIKKSKEKLASFKDMLRERKKSRLEDSLIDEPVLTEDNTNEDNENHIREQDIRTYTFIYKTAKNFSRVLKNSNFPLFIFLLIDLFCLSQIDFDKSSPSEQKDSYNYVFNSLFESYQRLIDKEDLSDKDIISELL